MSPKYRIMKGPMIAAIWLERRDDMQTCFSKAHGIVLLNLAKVASFDRSLQLLSGCRPSFVLMQVHSCPCNHFFVCEKNIPLFTGFEYQQDGLSSIMMPHVVWRCPPTSERHQQFAARNLSDLPWLAQQFARPPPCDWPKTPPDMARS